MEFVLKNNMDLLKLKDMFETMENEEKPTIEELEEEETTVHTEESEIDEEIIPESFSINDVDKDLIPDKLLEKRLCKEFLKEVEKDSLLLYHYHQNFSLFHSNKEDIEEKYNEIEKKVYYSFYKLLQSEEWEEILYEKIIESNLTKDFFLLYFSSKGLLRNESNDIFFFNDPVIKDKYKELVHSLFEEIEI